MPSAPMPPQGQPGQQQPPDQGQDQSGSGPAEKAIQMIQQGFQGLGQLIQQAKGLGDDDKALFQKAVQATDDLIQSLTSEPDEDDAQQKPQPKSPGGAMPSNANANAKPMPPGSY